MGESGCTTSVIHVNGVDLHVAEQGSGPAVVLCHGFPGLSYSWRHQLPALAAAGYRAIAPDMRGYGRSSSPGDPSEYDRVTTVADMIGLLDALGIERAFFSGHDFGAQLVWDLPRWAPERVAGLVQLSVPLTPRPPVAPSVSSAHLARKHFLHLHYFQEPGVADRELDARPADFLARVMWALSDTDRYLQVWGHPSEGNGYLDVLPPAPELPWPWLTASEFDHYVNEFTRTGFTGGLNWYRAADYVWHQNADHAHVPIEVPTAFVAGDRDPVLAMMGTDPLDTMRSLAPGLESTTLIDGAGHFVQMQEPDQVNAAMLAFLDRQPRWV
ncbi:alpha/beta hydrolase [Rhodococcus sp. HNM0569]|uniref:alpha/beta fold hydrolase n=1 Tax=Rhodococcus sp. HNM0569 TaxID=2716340 RepID=UPI00146D3499|nr:alpha/beta hydrolase [Rhodococcus sp. HNM0569]NLU83239.1 alpha/beta hydrolase [Rhodococcus sp. HNM0569]